MYLPCMYLTLMSLKSNIISGNGQESTVNI